MHSSVCTTPHGRRYYSRGLDVTPALSLTNESVISGNAAKYVAEVAEFANSVNISGLMLDFEPDTSEVAWVHACERPPLLVNSDAFVNIVTHARARPCMT